MYNTEIYFVIDNNILPNGKVKLIFQPKIDIFWAK